MHRKLLGFGVFLLYGSFGMLSGIASSHVETNASDVVQRLEMSDEEKDRRRDECARVRLLS